GGCGAGEGGAAHPRRVDRARRGAEGGARRLRRRRRRHRRPVDPPGLRRSAGRFLHPAASDRRRDLARGAPGAFCLVVRRRAAPVRRNVVAAAAGGSGPRAGSDPARRERNAGRETGRPSRAPLRRRSRPRVTISRHGDCSAPGPGAAMIFWANLLLTYLAFSLAYVYCENVYRYAPITALLSAATLKTAIVTGLMALSALAGAKKTEATGQDAGLKELILRFVGSAFRSPFGALLPLAIIAMAMSGAYYYRYVRLEALPDDLRGVPLDVTVRLRKSDTPSPLKTSLPDGSYLEPLRQADADHVPELTVSDAVGFHKKSTNLAEQFSWLDYFLGNPVPASSWFDRSVLEPLSIGVEALDANRTYHRYPGTLVPRMDVPYFTA